MDIVLGDNPILVPRGSDLVVEWAYMTPDGQWHEIVVSNGYELSKSSEISGELARTIQRVFAASVQASQECSVLRSKAPLGPSDVGFSYRGTQTHVVVDKTRKGAALPLLAEGSENLALDNDRASVLLGSLIRLPRPIGPCETVHDALALLYDAVMPHYVEQTFAPPKEEDPKPPTQDPEPPKPPREAEPPLPSPEPDEQRPLRSPQYPIDPLNEEFERNEIYTRLQPKLERVFSRRAHEETFPFNKDCKHSADEFIRFPSVMNPQERRRIQNALIEYAESRDNRPVHSFLTEIAGLGETDEEKREAVRLVLLILTEKQRNLSKDRFALWRADVYEKIYSHLGLNIQ